MISFGCGVTRMVLEAQTRGAPLPNISISTTSAEATRCFESFHDLVFSSGSRMAGGYTNDWLCILSDMEPRGMVDPVWKRWFECVTASFASLRGRVEYPSGLDRPVVQFGEPDDSELLRRIVECSRHHLNQSFNNGFACASFRCLWNRA